MRQGTQTIIILAGLALAAAGGFWGARFTAPAAATTEPAAEEAAAIPVETVAVRSGHIEETATAYGVVQNQPAAAVAVTAAFESVTSAVHVSVGDTVAGGAALIDLDASPDSKLQLRQAEEAAAAAERQVAQVTSRRDDHLATNADVTAAEQALTAAKTQLESQKARGSTRAKTLTASVDGVVSAVSTQPGQLNAAGTALVVVAPRTSIEVRIGVEPANAPLLKNGAPVKLRNTATAADADAVVGTVRQVTGSLNPQTRLTDVFITLPTDAQLPVGAFIEATYARRATDGLIVPRLATVSDDDGWAVFVVKDGKAAKHTVKLGLASDDDVQIIGDGLTAGNAVVTVRNGELEDGAAVEIGTARESTTAPTTGPEDGK